MPKKQGKCVNIDCDNYKQTVEVETGEDFECPLCHQHLEEIGGKDNGKKKGGGKSDGPNWKIIGGAAAAVVILGGGIAALTLGGGKTDANANGVDTDTVKIETPVKTQEPVKGGKKNGGDEATSNKSGYGTAKTPYGKYTGDLQNGQPHGHGTVVFSKPYRLGEEEAQPGDSYEGEFRDGRISGGPGYWSHDGEVTYVNP